MSKVGESPVTMRNYWLEKHIEDENPTYEGVSVIKMFGTTEPIS